MHGADSPMPAHESAPGTGEGLAALSGDTVGMGSSGLSGPMGGETAVAGWKVDGVRGRELGADGAQAATAKPTTRTVTTGLIVPPGDYYADQSRDVTALCMTGPGHPHVSG